MGFLELDEEGTSHALGGVEEWSLGLRVHLLLTHQSG